MEPVPEVQPNGRMILLGLTNEVKPNEWIVIEPMASEPLRFDQMGKY